MYIHSVNLTVQADGLLRRMLGNTDNAADKDTDVTRQPRWRKVEGLAKSYLGNTLHMLGAFDHSCNASLLPRHMLATISTQF
jgi:hypothetical protein